MYNAGQPQSAPTGNPSGGGDGSLESLGLVDPQSGRALPTSDWSPSRTPAPSDDQLRQQRQEGTWDDQDTQPNQPAYDPASQWESDDNPYRTEALRLRQAQADPGRQATEHLQSRTREIDTQAQGAFSQLVASGMPAEQAQFVVGAARAAALSDAQMQADRLALLPAAKREVASRIAAEFSLPNSKIDPGEILGEGSVEAMRARARTLQETRRSGAFQARRSSGVDRVERGAGPGTKIDYDNLSITDTIKLGILRGQFS